MMLRFSNTKLSMLFKILCVGEAPWVELDELSYFNSSMMYNSVA